MRWWEKSIGGSGRGRIIGMLRRRDRSVDELATELGVTDNAVRAQLQALERDGVVHQTGTRYAGKVGKPATTYGITPESETLFSTAYAPVLVALVGALREHLSGDELDAVFQDVGRRLVPETAAPAANRQQLQTRVEKASELLGALGAELDVEPTATGFALNGHACPLAAVVRSDPRACQMVQQLICRVTGADVHVCCDHSGTPKCGFAIERMHG
jgi:predicted ArsR family transcriptional regulator